MLSVGGFAVSPLTAVDIAVGLGWVDRVVAQLGVVWGKSAGKAGGRMNLLLCHLLDTAAVAEQLWSHYLSPRTRALLDELSSGQGCRLFMWLCGVHDCGKATPAFQSVDEESARHVRASGLDWDPVTLKRHQWRHDKAGAKLLRDLLSGLWDPEHVGWVWPLVAGHHGGFPSVGVFGTPPAKGEHQGRKAVWRPVQEAVVTVLTRALGYPDVAAVQPVRSPSRAEQLELSGLIVMADWIASDERYFTGIDELARVSLGVSRERAAKAWEALNLRGGWGQLPTPAGELIAARFGQRARPSQRLVIDTAWRMPAPGLVILEAPMGEGKTKAALAAAEVLAARFGAHGVFVGMPTQATSDPMFSQVRTWATAFGDHVADQTVLLHGKRMFNAEWRRLLAEADDDPDAIYGGVGLDDPYGAGCGGQPERRGPAEWFLGRKRGLLASLAVGTVDQLLHAATRTRHVMLRFAGLTGKVVILDEVHAADIYMEQFLAEALRWLGQARVPVILLSATLPPQQRQRLVDAYLRGALGEVRVQTEGVPVAAGYPNITAAFANDGQPGFLIDHAPSWRDSQPVVVEVAPDVTADSSGVVDLLRRELAHGGIALVIHNTVDRAQSTFRALGEHFGEDVRLLHGRLCAADRATRTEECLRLLGEPGQRPPRLIVVATQLAEQSFDVDADLLITDLAPIDLLLQRIGRLHRHKATRRPVSLGTPRVIVTGFDATALVPRFLRASEAIYGRHRLLRTAALVIGAAGDGGWSIPADVPRLVAQVYDDDASLVPREWAIDAEAARHAWLAKEEDRALKAEGFLLARRGETTRPTLAGLHYGEAHGTRDDEDLTALVRDGEPSVEVVIVRRHPNGYTALNGSWLGTHGEAAPDVLDQVLAGTTRLPTKLTDEAESALRPLDGWTSNPWLRNTRALVLDHSGTAELGHYRVSYHPQLGLVIEPTRPEAATPRGAGTT